MRVSGLELDRGQMPIVQTTKLSSVANSHSLRCDAKQAERRFDIFTSRVTSVDHFHLGDFFPNPFIKGTQPSYLEAPEADAVPVVNTLSIQRLSINTEDCRYISLDSYNNLSNEKKLQADDVLLTVDGGTSIGKPVLFDLEGDYSVDSHIAILRPVGISPKIIVYLLASPFGQLQFQQAESGASGQTAVTEEDIRRFKFPKVEMKKLTDLVKELDEDRSKIIQAREKLAVEEQRVWGKFNLSMLEVAE